MIRTRPALLSLALFLLLSGGTSSADKNPRLTSPKPAAGGVTKATAVRLHRGPNPTPLGAGECPQGIEIELWPPNHKVVDIDLQQVFGPTVTGIEILSITQDEPINDRGDGNTECDGDGIGTSVAHIRSERTGLGNGRVYEIEYSAFQGACGGFVHVLVPHDRSGRPAEDDGQDFDSTEGCP